jgi:Rv0078B-related antitoxin
MNAPIVAQKTGVQISLELTEFGMQMVAAKHTREHPDATAAQVAATVRAWLLDRPGAPGGDCPGRPWRWSHER